jgi:hypothetical protein
MDSNSSAVARTPMKGMYVGYDENQDRVWVLDCAGRYFIAREEQDSESYQVQRAAWVPMPANIFDVLVQELLAHPELAQAKYEKPI